MLPVPRLRCWFAAVLLTGLATASPLRSSEPHWIRVDSSHFSVLTDVDQEKAHEVSARFEQMRSLFAELLMKTRVNMSEPIEIIAFKSSEEYEKAAPARASEGLGAGFFLPRDDRVYFVLNLAQEESWRAISYDFARVLLNYNYPPTQPWFDEGFAEYFSSARLSDQQMQIGGDPEARSEGAQPAGKSFVEILNAGNWQSLPELFSDQGAHTDRHTLFCAQSWVTMHYLITADKLSAAGSYFELIENEKLSVEDAIQKAFGISSEQLGKAIKDYYQSLLEMLQQQNNPNAKKIPMPAPVAADQVGTSFHDIPEAQARALIAEMTLRVPEHREPARLELEQLINDPKSESVIAHRALGWYYLDKKDFGKANDELSSALALDNHDAWTHFYLALCKDRKAEASGQERQGLANMIQDLHIVLDWYPEFAEAYAMLARAQLEGGGLRAATDSIRAAVKLNPRKPAYLLEIARVYMEGKNWDAATSLLQVLSANPDSKVASAARAELQELPYVKKYGVPPQQAAQQTSKTPPNAAPPASSQKTPAAPPPQPAAATNDQDSEEPSEPQLDRRPIQYLKGKLVGVDCSQAPIATVTVSSGAKTLKFRTSDYKSLTVIGADSFSCSWTNLAVSVNYKAGGKSDGDLVSIELQ